MNPFLAFPRHEVDLSFRLDQGRVALGQACANWPGYYCELAFEGSTITKANRVIALCSLATLLDGYDLSALGLAIPHMAREAGSAPPVYALAVSASLLGMALGAVLIAPLADRWGRRPVLIAMMWLIGLTMLPAMLGTDPKLLAFCRLFTGLGLGATIPVATALTSEYAVTKHPTAVVTLMICFAGIGSLVAGLVAPPLVLHFGWRGIFGLGVALPLISAVLFSVALPESKQFQGEREARRGPGGAAAPQLSASGLRRAWQKPFGFLTALLASVFALNFFVNLALISWLPSLLTAARWSTAEASHAAAFVAFGGIAGSLLIAYIADRGHAVPALVSAYLLATLLLALFTVMPDSRVAWTSALFIIGACSYGALLAVGSLTAAYYPADLRSSGVGITSGTGRFVCVFAMFGMAGLMRSHISSGAIISLLLVPMLACAGCMTLLNRALVRARTPLR